jgi:hypothetical protein
MGEVVVFGGILGRESCVYVFLIVSILLVIYNEYNIQ